MPDEIVADVEELLIVLRANRDRHVAEFSQQQEAFKARAIEKMRANLDQAITDGAVVLNIQLPIPENHAADYDREIRMLEMHQDSKISIHAHLFDQVVMDRWGWTAAFAGTGSVYGTRR